MTQANKLIIKFDPSAWEDYIYWQTTDKKILKRINDLIKSTQRTPFEGLGKPEPLRGDFSGFWSRRINREHRLIYTLTDQELTIAMCRYHY